MRVEHHAQFHWIGFHPLGGLAYGGLELTQVQLGLTGSQADRGGYGK